MVNDIREPRRPKYDVPKKGDDEPAFEPPEQVAADEEIIDMGSVEEKPTTSKKPAAKASKTNPLAALFGRLKGKWEGWNRKQRAIALGVGGGLLLVLIGGGGFAVAHLLHKPAPKPQPVVQKVQPKPEPPKPTTVPSNLTGVQVPPEYNQLPVTGIMIENSPDARPQAGLKDAGVVFEAIAEGGITRFLTLFQEAQPDYVGPVRSVRPYYVSWLEAFDAGLAHVGGSPDGLAKVKADGVKDLDQFYNGGSYQRVNTRYAPHNVYTSLGSLIALQKSKGYNNSTFTGFPRKTEKSLTTPTAKTIDFAISSPLYFAHYDYDAATNSYKRSEGGKPHTDDKSGQQISPKVVIAIVTAQGIDSDGLHTTYETSGNGKAYIFQDGGVTEGTWSKDNDKSQIRFGDANSAPVALDPGQTWITVLGDASFVKYAP